MAAGHDLHMAELTGDAVLAALDLPVLQDRAADAGAQRDHDEVVLATAGAEAPLGPGRGVGVVVDENGHREPARETVPEGLVAPGQVRGEEHAVAVGVDPAGRADADGVHVVAVGEVQDQLDDRVLDDLRALGLVRGLRAELLQDVAVGVHDARHHLGAADVDAHGGDTGRRQVRAALSGAHRPQDGGSAGADRCGEVAVGAHQARLCRTLTLGAERGSDGPVPAPRRVRVACGRSHGSPRPGAGHDPGASIVLTLQRTVRSAESPGDLTGRARQDRTSNWNSNEYRLGR